MHQESSRVARLPGKSYRPALWTKVVIALGLFCLAGALWAQSGAPEGKGVHGYKILVPHEKMIDKKSPDNKKFQNDMRRDVRSILGGALPLAENRGRFEAFYTHYYFPFMTTEEGLKTIGEERVKFLRDHLEYSATRAPEARSVVLGVAVPILTKIVQDNFHPAARYNAMLILSDLNDKEATLGAQSVPPEPMARVLPFLLQHFQKEENPDSVKLAALLGLARHLEMENFKPTTSPAMPAALRTQVMDALIGLAQTTEVPAGREAEVHNWLRRRAIEGLAGACLVKPDAKVVDALVAILMDDRDALSVRCEVAANLGRMSLQPPVKIDAVAVAKELGYLALVACDAELTRATTKHKNDLEHEGRLTGNYSGGAAMGGEGGMGMGIRPGMGGMPGMGGGMPGMGEGGLRPQVRGLDDGLGGDETGFIDPSMLDPKHYRMDYLRRRMRQELYTVQLGLLGKEDHIPPKPGTQRTVNVAKTTASPDERGVFVVAKPAEKNGVDDIYFKVRELIKIIEIAPPHTELPQLDKDLRAKMTDLEAITKRLPPPGSADESEADDDAPAAPPAKTATTKPGAKKGPATKMPPGKGVPGKVIPGKPGPGKVIPKPGKTAPPAKPGAPVARPPGKSARLSPVRPANGVFAQPRVSR